MVPSWASREVQLCRASTAFSWQQRLRVADPYCQCAHRSVIFFILGVFLDVLYSVAALCLVQECSLNKVRRQPGALCRRAGMRIGVIISAAAVVALVGLSCGAATQPTGAVEVIVVGTAPSTLQFVPRPSS